MCPGVYKPQSCNVGEPDNFGEADDVGIARLLNELSAKKSMGKLNFVNKTRDL